MKDIHTALPAPPDRSRRSPPRRSFDWRKAALPTAIGLLLLFSVGLGLPTTAQPTSDLIIDLTSSPRVGGEVVTASGKDLSTVTVALTGGECPSVERTVPVDVVLVSDLSSSMNDRTGDNIPRIDALRGAATEFVGAFFNNPAFRDQMALVGFSDSAGILSGGGTIATAFETDASALRTIIAAFDTIGGTDVPAGIRLGTDVLAGPGGNFADGAAPVMVLMTDADTLDDSGIRREAARARRVRQGGREGAEPLAAADRRGR